MSSQPLSTDSCLKDCTFPTFLWGRLYFSMTVACPFRGVHRGWCPPGYQLHLPPCTSQSLLLSGQALRFTLSLPRLCSPDTFSSRNGLPGDWQKAAHINTQCWRNNKFQKLFFKQTSGQSLNKSIQCLLAEIEISLKQNWLCGVFVIANTQAPSK